MNPFKPGDRVTIFKLDDDVEYSGDGARYHEAEGKVLIVDRVGDFWVYCDNGKLSFRANELMPVKKPIVIII